MTDFDPNRRPDPRLRPTPTQARQGPMGRPVFYVLIAALALALLAWAGMEFYPRGASRTAEGTGPGERIAPTAPADPQSTGSTPAAPRAPSGSSPATSDSAR
jgi:hypothetical protein